MSISKKIAVISIVATVLPALTLAYTGIPAGFTFTKNLSSGMHDADVVYLKTILADEGCVSGLANTDYFASKTKAGVQCFCNKYKAEISTAAGYTVSCTGLVGTGVRSKLNALLGVAPGATPTPTPAGAAEGTYNVALSATPVSRTVNGGTGLEAYGIDVTARGSDITIGKIDLQVAVVNAVTAVAMSPATLITAIKIYDTSISDANLKATYVNPTFVQDANTNWYTSLTTVNFLVPKDTTKKVLITIDTASSFDQNRTVTVNVYGNNGIRGRDTMGIDTYAALATTRVLTVQRAGNAVLTISTASTNPDSQNIYMDATVGVQTPQPVLSFRATATAGDAILARLEITYGASAGSEAIPNILYLYNGDTLVASATPNSRAGVAVDQVAVFSNFQSKILQDQTATFTIKSAWPVVDSGNNLFTASIPVVAAATDCGFIRADGSTVACTGAAIEQGNTFRIFDQGVKLALVSATATSTPISSTQNGTANGVIVFSVQPFGGTLTQITNITAASAPTATGSNVLMEAYWSSSVVLPLAASASVGVTRTIAQIPSRNLNDGETGTITCNMGVSSSESYGSGSLRFKLDGVHWVVGNQSVYQGEGWGPENVLQNITDNWFTSYVNIQ